MLFVKAVLTAPGVPLVCVLKAQFWPLPFGTSGLRSSSVRPPSIWPVAVLKFVPSAAEYHSQPREMLSTGPRWRTAQSPSSA